MRLRMITIICVFAMVAALCGCDTEPNTPTDLGPAIVTSPADENGLVITTQYLPGNVNNPDDLPVLKWVCLTESFYGGGPRTWSEEAAKAVNELLEERNMPFRIQFVLLTTNQSLLNFEWFSKQEVQEALRDADLIFANMSSKEMVQYLAPITEYATGEKAPSLENNVVHPYMWKSVDGEIYGLPAIPGVYQSAGWRIDETLMEDFGLSADDFATPFYEMDEIFSQIYQQNGSKAFLYVASDGAAKTVVKDNLSVEVFPSALGTPFYISNHTVVSCFAIDYSGEIPTVVNYLEQDAVKNWQAAIIRYREAGYVTKDQRRAKVQFAGCDATTVFTDEEGKVQIPVEQPLFKNVTSGTMVSGISATTDHMEEALELLALIGEDEDFRMHLFYGAEGRDYTIEDGYYQIVKNNNQNYSLDFLSPLSYFCGLTAHPEATSNPSVGTRYGVLAAADGMNAFQTIQTNLDNAFRCCPVTFDFTGLERELIAVNAVLDEYFARFSELKESEYAQMLQELRDAGSETIQAELQRQLDAWLVENPE